MFCTQACQVSHWKGGHKVKCKSYTQKEAKLKAKAAVATAAADDSGGV